MDSKEGLRQTKFRMKNLLSEAIAMLCKNSIQFNCELAVEGLLGITVDDEDVILININEVLQGKEAAATESSLEDADKASSLRTLLETSNMRVTQIHAVSEGKHSEVSLCVPEEGVFAGDVNSTAVCSSPKKTEMDEESCEQRPPPKRKQRRPKQYKEEEVPQTEGLVEDGEEDDSDVWENFSPVYNPVPLNNTPHCVKREPQGNKNCVKTADQDMEMGRFTGSIQAGDKGRHHPTSEVPNVPSSPTYKYGKDFGLALRNESTILSIPSPKSIYGKKSSIARNDMKRNDLSNNFQSTDGDTKSDIIGEYISMEPEYMSDNENESESSLALSGEGNQIGDMPIDLSIDSPISSKPNRRRGRGGHHSSPHDEEVNSQGAIRCPECRKWFESRIKYNRHKRSHRGIFTCRVCGRAYNRKDNMQRHYKLYHTAYFQKQGMGDLDDISSHSAFTRDLDDLEAS